MKLELEVELSRKIEKEKERRRTRREEERSVESSDKIYHKTQTGNVSVSDIKV